MDNNLVERFSRITRAVIGSLILGWLMLAVGCGGGGGLSSNLIPPSSQPTPAPAGSTTTQIRVGDAAVDRIIAFEISIASPIVLTPSGGGARVNLSINPNRLELSHRSATLEPLAVNNVPQGSFSSMDITITNPEMTFLTNAGSTVHLQSSATQTITVTFNPALTIGTSPTILNVDVKLANSVSTDAGGNITGFNFTGSSFNITTKAIGIASQEQDDDGELEDIRGLVASVNGSNFTLNVGQSGAQLTFSTDSTTSFSDGVTTVASALNQIVKVEGFTRSDGSLFAKEVEGLENENGAELEGLITQAGGGLLTVSAQDGIGSGMDNTKVGTTFTVNISGLGASKFKVDQGNNFSGLTLPSLPNFPFDGTTIHQGQRIEVEAQNSIPPSAGSIIADKIKLQQQALDGTVSNFVAGTNGAATFDLTLPADSYLTILSGQTVVHVTKLATTDNRFGTIVNGSSVRVRGLLFFTGTTFNLVARRIMQ